MKEYEGKERIEILDRETNRAYILRNYSQMNKSMKEKERLSERSYWDRDLDDED